MDVSPVTEREVCERGGQKGLLLFLAVVGLFYKAQFTEFSQLA